MEGKNTKKWSSRNLTVKVINKICGRVDIHKNLCQEEADWIALDPNLKVEYLETKSYREREE